MQRSRRRLAIGACVYSLAFLLSLAIVEAGVRILAPQSNLRTQDLFFRPESFVGFEGIPNKRGIFATTEFKTTVVQNREGFRDRDHARENRDGRLRIVTVGDSFTWGHGVENDEIYMKVLERLEPRVETLNMGGPGGDPPSELKVYTSRGLAYQHDVLLVGFYMGNDVVSTHPTPDSAPPQWGFDEQGQFRLIGRELTPREVEAMRRASEQRFAREAQRDFADRIRYAVRSHLQLLTLLDNSRDYYNRLLTSTAAYVRVARLLGIASSRAFPFLDDCLPVDPPEVARAWQLTRATFERMKQEASRVGARLYVLLIPDVFQVAPAVYARELRRYGYDAADYDVAKPTRTLTALCRELAIACLDLTPTLAEAAARGELLYYPRDPHWTPRGHQLAAEALRTDLLQRGWLAGRPAASPGA